MWPLCTFSLGSALWLLLPLLLGLITGWAIWAGRRTADADLAYAAPEPVRAPDPVRVAEPVAAPAPKVEPVAVAAPVAAPKVAPVAVAAAVAMTAIGIPAAIGNPDDLLQIKGVGPKLNDLLHSLGIHRFDQISAWGRGEVGKVDEHLGAFKGRIDRDSWVEQAGLLAKGMIKEFEAKFGKLDSENQ
jgi:predicted flap endonuclease-1-like 5' DNA nuclease